MRINTDSMHGRTVVVRMVALLLLILGVAVLVIWHNPVRFALIYPSVTVMSYNTAICFLLSAICLLLLSSHKFTSLRILCLGIIFTSGLTVIEFYSNRNLGTNTWYLSLLPEVSVDRGRMSPSSSSSFLLIGSAFLLLSFCYKISNNNNFISVLFLNLLTIIIAAIALLGQALHFVSAFSWLNIHMALHSAIGLIVLASTLIFYIFPAAINSFNRLNFFKRIITAFGFMIILFIGIGSIALMQIQSVASITQELYKNPLQINNAALRIKENIGNFNRELKNFAIQPDSPQARDIPLRLSMLENKIAQEIQYIQELDEIGDPELQKLQTHFSQWKAFILTSYNHLIARDIESYRSITLNEGQDKVILLEQICEQIVLKAQKRIMELNQSVVDTENDAQNLMIIFVCAFLVIGLLVAFIITRGLTQQLNQIRLAMLDISHENTDIEIPFLDYTEEMGDMAKTLAVFAENIAVRRRMETRMRKIIEATPNGIIMVNADGIIEVVNEQAEKIFGYNRSELLNSPIEKLIPQRMAKSHPKNRDDFFTDPTPRSMGAGRDLFGLHKDGHEFPVEIGLAPIETEDGLKVLAAIVDISERKKSAQMLVEHQRELEKSNKRLAQTNVELEAFAYVASHDLKSPLRGIAQLSSWIEEDLAEKEFASVTDHTRMLRNRIQRMEKLLDDLLVFYRAGKVEGNLVTVDVKTMASELFEIQNNKPGLQLVLGENLPVFTSLSTPFEQVIRNFFSNAIKHHDLEQGKVFFNAKSVDDDFFEFSICDDGPGIPEKFQQRVFGMFQTLKPRDELEGSGMGLALIKKLVETYGGKITVQSEGRGCCFNFTWPKHIQRKNSND